MPVKKRCRGLNKSRKTYKNEKVAADSKQYYGNIGRRKEGEDEKLLSDAKRTTTNVSRKRTPSKPTLSSPASSPSRMVASRSKRSKTVSKVATVSAASNIVTANGKTASGKALVCQTKEGSSGRFEWRCYFDPT